MISDSAKSASGQFALHEKSLFNHDNVADLTQKIDYWIEQPEELQTLGNKYAVEADHYQISKVVDSIEDKYYELIENNLAADRNMTN